MSSPPLLCPNCLVKPPWPNFKHCGKKCAQEAAAKEAAAVQASVPTRQLNRRSSLPAAAAPGANPAGPTARGAGQSQSAIMRRPKRAETLKPVTGNYDPIKGAICKLPGCNDPPWQFGQEYCSMEHRAEAVKKGVVIACMLCHEYPKGLYGYCGWNCAEYAQRSATLLLLLDKRDPKWEEIRNRFETTWKSRSKALPQIRYIYKIQLGKSSMEAFFAYRARVEHARNFTAQRMAPGNECLKWYSTKRSCSVGDDPAKPTLCDSRNCILCFVLKNSFKKPLTPARGMRMRFGLGIYATAMASRADDYSINTGTATYKATILATVILGKGAKLTKDKPMLDAPPRGCDSVLTETGSTMAFDEVVVYDNDAIRPVWLVIYGS